MLDTTNYVLKGHTMNNTNNTTQQSPSFFASALNSVSDFVASAKRAITNKTNELKAWARDFSARNPLLSSFIKGMWIGFVAITLSTWAVLFTVAGFQLLLALEILASITCFVLAYYLFVSMANVINTLF